MLLRQGSVVCKIRHILAADCVLFIAPCRIGGDVQFIHAGLTSSREPGIYRWSMVAKGGIESPIR